MSKVTIYTTRFCPYCVRAKSLLEKKNAEYVEIAVDSDHEQRSIMEQRSRQTSVPQIFIGEQHIGGCDDLHALEAAGELDTRLAV
ncbi:Glutaredoxin 3 (Grx2) [hydrothermal vent metagenome]|uniref:Glutaredoxin 3 (Grx2) n=1 Tax=hydrothermal vent metagenome TaxID=652676 RepID=A0A3B1B8T4_9ZZZZ